MTQKACSVEENSLFSTYFCYRFPDVCIPGSWSSKKHLLHSAEIQISPSLQKHRNSWDFFPLLISVLQPSIQSYFPFFSLVFKTPNASSTVFFLFPQQSPWSLSNFFAFFSQHRDEIFSPQSHRKIAGQSRNRHSTGSSETWMWPHHQDASRLQATYTHCKLLNGFQASRCQDTWKHY